MKKLLYKIAIHGLFIFIILECMVRVFHFHANPPQQYIDDYGVRKLVPLQEGYNVTGNRRQHVTRYQVNNIGFNSIQTDFPKEDNYNVELIGDSYIEGLHQPNHNSIGVMLASKLDSLKVYEYGVSGYDMADQLHFVQAYNKELQHIDEIILYMKFENDFERSAYEPLLISESKLDKLRNHSKLLTYLRQLGILNSLKSFLTTNTKKLLFKNEIQQENSIAVDDPKFSLQRIANFKKLMKTYNFQKNKMTLLLDSRFTNTMFLDFCKENNIKIIDFKQPFQSAEKETSLVYDAHWNSYGRELIADTIFKHLTSKNE